MSKQDQSRWQERYAGKGPDTLTDAFPLDVFTPVTDCFPTSGLALEIACGRGATAVWLARRGMHVRAVDISPTAIELARKLACQHNLSDQCRFEVFDLDQGLPDTPAVDLLVCHHFRDPGLYSAFKDCLKPGGILAIATLSEVGATPGKFRANTGELKSAFCSLDIILEGEAEGRAWLVARKPECA